MKETAGFYGTPAWKATRLAYAKSCGGLCERCLSRGIYRVGEIVHHKIHMTPVNMHDPDVALSWNNLQLLCRDCHALMHKPTKRYKVDELGRVTVRE